jgi:hypothetical protein
MWYMHSITNVLSDHLGWHRARLKFMARFTVALLQRTTTDLWALAVALKGGVEPASNHRRIQRFLSEYNVDFAMLGGLIAHLVPESPPYEVVVDRTEWEFGDTPVNILTVGIVHDKMAFPIAWTALSSGGGSGSEDQIGVLERFLQAVDPSSVKVLTADREFISAGWLKRLNEEDIPFAIRLRSDRKVADTPDRGALAARMYARAVVPGTERVLEKERYLFGDEGETTVPVRVVIRRIGAEKAEDPFLILATRGIDPEEASTFYRKRWSIETMFAALKSRGFCLEETHLTAPGRIERLLGLLALAFTWARLVGEVRTRRKGPPPRKSHGRRQWSVFRYGLDVLTNLLTTDKSKDRAFFECLTALRSPRATVKGL